MNDTINLEYNLNLNLHIINSNNYNEYSSLLDNSNICDPEFLDALYENLSYLSIEDENVIGFFVTDKNNKNVYVSMVIDLDCNQLLDKIKKYNYLKDETIEINLLCSNYKQRIPGLTNYVVKYIFQNLLKKYKPSVKHIILYVGKGSTHNQKATNFYYNLGFKNIADNVQNLLVYSYSNTNNTLTTTNSSVSSGGKRKKRTLLKKRKSVKNTLKRK